MTQAKIALGMILKADEPPEMLKRCLMHVGQFVDSIYLTITQEQKVKPLEEIASLYKANVSYVKWEDDFAKARNFNLDQIPAEYDFIIWLDVDDVLQLGSNLRAVADKALEENVDLVFCRYLYQVELNEKGSIKEIIIEHMRERLFRNKRGRWVGGIHETIILDNAKNIAVQELVVVHLTDDSRMANNLERNIRILELQVKKEERKDPRTVYYLGKAYFDKRHEDVKYVDEAMICFVEYLSPNEHSTSMSGWSDERAACWEYLSECFRIKSQPEKSIECLLKALDEADQYPSTYLSISAHYAQATQWDRAQRWLDIATKLPIPMTTMIINPRDLKTRALEIAYHIGINTGKLESALEAATQLKEILGTKEMEDRIIYVSSMISANRAIQSIVYLAKYYEQIGDRSLIPTLIQSAPPSIANEPILAEIRQVYLPERRHKDNEITIFCGPGFEQWSPKNVEQGIGGSEEAVIYLSRELAKLGWKVTVYADPGGDAGEYDGVKFEPYFNFNPKDRFNIFISWRRMLDMPNAQNKYVWLHDIPNSSEFTEERLKDLDKVIVLSKFHRECLPNVPDDKIMISSNGVVL
jgi:tetratricopeptide (TPR) repeat protein